MSDKSSPRQAARRLGAAARASTPPSAGRTRGAQAAAASQSSLATLLARSTNSDLLDRLLAAPLDPAMRFNAFAVGQTNRAAFSAARRVAMQAVAPYNPLFILSGVGNGKTHLLQALAKRRRSLFPKQKTLYLTGEALAGEYVVAVRRRQEDSFIDMMRGVDVLVLDDAHGLAAADAGQKTIAALLEEGLKRNKALIVAASRPPGQLELDKSIVKLLRTAHLAPISSPEAALRLAALEKAVAQAERRGQRIAVERRAIEFMAREMPVSIRVLRAALGHVAAIGEARGKPASVGTIREELGDFLQNAQRQRRLEALKRSLGAP